MTNAKMDKKIISIKDYLGKDFLKNKLGETELQGIPKYFVFSNIINDFLRADESERQKTLIIEISKETSDYTSIQVYSEIANEIRKQSKALKVELSSLISKILLYFSMLDTEERKTRIANWYVR